jgi:hypothetical protein
MTLAQYFQNSSAIVNAMVATATRTGELSLGSSLDQVGAGEGNGRAAAFTVAPVAIAPTRGDLMRRLHDCPDDFAATKALQALSAASRQARPNADPAPQDAIVRAGLSSIQRMRRWITRRTR